MNPPSDLKTSRKWMESLCQTNHFLTIRFNDKPAVDGEFVHKEAFPYHRICRKPEVDGEFVPEHAGLVFFPPSIF